MRIESSRLWWLMAPMAVLGSAYLAAQLRAPATLREPLQLGDRVELSFAGLADASTQQGGFLAPAGTFVLVVFGYTSCPDVCPTTLFAVHELLEELGPDARRVTPVFISVDPARDTAERLLKYTAAFDARIIALTGPPDAVARTARLFHVSYAKQPARAGSTDYSVNHTAVMYLVDPAGRVIAAVPETGAPREIAAAAIRNMRSASP